MRRLTQRYYGSMMGRSIHKRIIGFPREAKFGKFYIGCFHDEGQFELEDDSKLRSIYTTNNLNSRMSSFQSNEINAGAFWENTTTLSSFTDGLIPSVTVMKSVGKNNTDGSRPLV